MKKTSLFILLMLMTVPAYAYLDSGTGSMVIQMLFAAVAGALAMIKLYWQKVKKGWQFFCARIRGEKAEKSASDSAIAQDKQSNHD
ncbi:MAG: hypothetical protein HKM04_00545 [Legionellales bacterium]|nr:hypothetical protein [Legionellales bacterium]